MFLLSNPLSRGSFFHLEQRAAVEAGFLQKHSCNSPPAVLLLLCEYVENSTERDVERPHHERWRIRLLNNPPVYAKARIFATVRRKELPGIPPFDTPRHKILGSDWDHQTFPTRNFGLGRNCERSDAT